MRRLSVRLDFHWRVRVGPAALIVELNSSHFGSQPNHPEVRCLCRAKNKPARSAIGLKGLCAAAYGVRILKSTRWLSVQDSMLCPDVNAFLKSLSLKGNQNDWTIGSCCSGAGNRQTGLTNWYDVMVDWLCRSITVTPMSSRVVLSRVTTANLRRRWRRYNRRPSRPISPPNGISQSTVHTLVVHVSLLSTPAKRPRSAYCSVQDMKFSD